MGHHAYEVKTNATPAGAADNGTTLRVHDPHEPPAESTVNGSPPEASRSDGTGSPVQVDPDSHRALVALIRRKGGQMTARQLQRAHPRKYRTRQDAEVALDALARDGCGQWVTLPTAKRGQPIQAVVLHETGGTNPLPVPPSSVTEVADTNKQPLICRPADTTCPDRRREKANTQSPATGTVVSANCRPAATVGVDTVAADTVRTPSAWPETPPGTRDSSWNENRADKVMKEVEATLRTAFVDHAGSYERCQRLGLLVLAVRNAYARHDVAFWQAAQLIQDVVDRWKPVPATSASNGLSPFLSRGLLYTPCSPNRPCTRCKEPEGCFWALDGRRCMCSRVKQGADTVMLWKGRYYWFHSLQQANSPQPTASPPDTCPKCGAASGCIRSLDGGLFCRNVREGATCGMKVDGVLYWSHSPCVL